jgi:N-dimethylarginine dimethylaminohydrolase
MSDRFLMCAPENFEVIYVINPWMQGNIAFGNSVTAMQQWNALTQLIATVAGIESIASVPGLPDMVFTANAGLVLGNKFVLSHFRHPERQGEEPYFAQWFGTQGFETITFPQEIFFEGAGDALLDRHLPLLWLGYGHRSSEECAALLTTWLDIEVQPLRLVNTRFYHLDTCFCPLSDGYLMYYPAAFDAVSQAQIALRVPVERRIFVSDEDAHDFACNAIESERTVFMNRASPELIAQLQSHGFVVRQTPLTEFLKAGGSAKCLSLKLNEPYAGRGAK